MTGSRIKIKDMTVGNPTRMIIEFAVPLLIGNIFQQIYSVVDTMVAGYNLGDNAIAAIGATMSLFGVIINIAFGMNGGFALVVTRCFGAHRDDELRKSIAGMLTLDLIISLALTGLAMMFLRPLMHFMNTPDVIFNEAYSYMSVLCMGIIATMAYNMFSSILRAVGNSVIPLVALIIACVLNIILDIVFIALMHMGVGGAALATIIAQVELKFHCNLGNRGVITHHQVSKRFIRKLLVINNYRQDGLHFHKNWFLIDYRIYLLIYS